jgi:hypothetical protein
MRVTGHHIATEAAKHYGLTFGRATIVNLKEVAK